MKQITELKKDDKLYDTGNLQVRSYVYLCVHPTGKGKYHILINENQDPERWHENRLQACLDKNLTSYKEARLRLIGVLKEYIKELESEK